MFKRAMLVGLTALLTAGTAVTISTAARAADPAEIILIRREGQELLAAAFMGLKTAIDAKADVKPLAGRAAAMAKWMRVFPLQFPPGSDKGRPNQALPAIWSDRAGFDKAAANFVDASMKLAMLAKDGDADGFAAQWRVTGQSCVACHKDYRSK